MLVGTLEKLTEDFKVEHQKLTETVSHNDINEHNYNDILNLYTCLQVFLSLQYLFLDIHPQR